MGIEPGSVRQTTCCRSRLLWCKYSDLFETYNYEAR